MHYGVWCIKEAAEEQGHKCPVLRSGSCDLVLAWGREHECMFTTPEPADLFLVMASPSDATHTGFVESVQPDGRIATVEGNSNDDGSREGHSVVERTRRATGLLYVRWPLVLPPPVSVPAAEPAYRLLLPSGAALTVPLIENVAYVPARELGEALGFTVGWDGEKRQVSLGRVPVAALPLLRGGQAFVPARKFAAAAGLPVAVDARTRTVRIG